MDFCLTEGKQPRTNRFETPQEQYWRKGGHFAGDYQQAGTGKRGLRHILQSRQLLEEIASISETVEEVQKTVADIVISKEALEEANFKVEASVC